MLSRKCSLSLFFISNVLNRFIVSFFDYCRRAECILKAEPPVDWWILLCCSGLACTSNAALAVRADNVYSRISFSSYLPPSLSLSPSSLSFLSSISSADVFNVCLKADASSCHTGASFTCRLCVYEYVCALVSNSCSSAVAFLINTGVFFAPTE